MRTPIRKFAKDENVSVRFLYNEANKGRLLLTKVGSRTFVDDEDAACWRALAPKVGGDPGAVRALKDAERALTKLVDAINTGNVKYDVAADRLRTIFKQAEGEHHATA